VRSAVWRDIVFVNVSGDAPPFEDFIRPLDERMSRWTATELWPLCSDEYEVRANWKLAAENFLDVYHLPVVHSQLGGGFAGALTSEDVEISDDIVGVVMPDGYGEGSGQADSPLPRFSGLGPGDRLRIEVFAVFPNTLILVEPEFQQVIVLRPQAPGVTHETFANYLVSEASASEELAKVRDEAACASVEVNDQDAALLASLQQTRSMDVGGDTQLNQAWDQTVRRFQRIWARKLLAGP
jgi:phenylpropionate dioxygenase-like ring-hydroxylating dioxygenase large terminal subunit